MCLRNFSTKAMLISLLGSTFISMFPSVVHAQTLVPLELYWHPEREDNFVTATPEGSQSALEAGYSYARVEACVFPTQRPGTVPLNLYWNAQREDNFTTATSIGARSARESGYTFARVEGYVYQYSGQF
jgi:hypothetical protein